MKKTVALILSLILMFSALLTGCSNSILDPDHPAMLTMWHNYGGEMPSAMDCLIDRFNVTVGKEGDTLAELRK